MSLKGTETKICRILKALHGLKQAPRAWNAKIHAHLLQLSFVNSPTESTLYVRKDGEKLLIVVLYVDDLLITGSDEQEIADFKADVSKTFELTDLDHLEDCKPISTPVEAGFKFSYQDKGEPTDVLLYQQAVGCLIFLCNTRPDIQYAVSQLSRFMHSPGTKHWQAAKWVFH